MIEWMNFSVCFEVYVISAIIGTILLLVRLYLLDRNLEEEEISDLAKLHLALAIFLMMFGLCGILLDTDAYSHKFKSRFWSSLVLGIASILILRKLDNDNQMQKREW